MKQIDLEQIVAERRQIENVVQYLVRFNRKATEEQLREKINEAVDNISRTKVCQSIRTMGFYVMKDHAGMIHVTLDPEIANFLHKIDPEVG